MNDERRDPIMPSLNPENEPTDANPVPLSPTDPKHRTEEDDPDALIDPKKQPDPRVIPLAAPFSGGSPASVINLPAELDSDKTT